MKLKDQFIIALGQEGDYYGVEYVGLFDTIDEAAEYAIEHYPLTIAKVRPLRRPVRKPIEITILREVNPTS